MKSRAEAILVLLCLATGPSVHAQANPDSALSSQGFSGILNTPHAHVQQEGTVDVLYSNQRENISTIGTPKWEDSYLFSVGIFSFAEVGGRLTNTGRVGNKATGIRDLSLNFKLSSAPLTSRFRFSPALAVGMQDVSGGGGDDKSSARYFGTKYVAGSADPLSWLRLSAGYGSGPDRMKGAFGGMELRAQDWVTLLGDYDTSNTNAGVRLTTPALPYLPARFTATFSTPIGHSPGLVVSAGLIIPLNFKKSSRQEARTASHRNPRTQRSLWGALTSRKVESSALESVSAPPVGPSRPSSSTGTAPIATTPSRKPSSTNNTVEPMPVQVLRDRLIRAGFVNVRVGLQKKTIVVEYENIRYNHNELDAIGVVAGIASQAAGTHAEVLRLVVRRKGLALLQIEAQLPALRNWLEGNSLAQQPTFKVTKKLASESGTSFIAGKTNPGRLKPSVMVYPSLTTLVGTEHGLFDYQLSIKPELQVPFWPGASGVARWDLPVAWSANLNDGQVYASYRTSPQLDRLMFFQALPLAPGLVVNIGGGKLLTTTNGTLNELSWTPGGGINRLKAIQSWGRDGGSTRNVLLGSYRFFLARHDLAFEGIGGRFWGQDTGFMVSMKRFFGDASVSLYFKESVTPVDSKRWRQAGLQIEFPLTRRRDMKAQPVQVRGHEDWVYAQETGVASSTVQNYNYVKPGLATVPEPTQSLATYFYDRERLNEDYIVSHTERIREAWRSFRDDL